MTQGSGSQRRYSSNEAALDVSRALALGGPSGGVGVGLEVIAQADQRDGVQRLVELTVAATVQAMAGDLAGGGGDRASPGQGGKGGLGAEPAGMRPADQQLGGADGADAEQLQQPRRDRRYQPLQLAVELLGLGLEGLDAAGGAAQHPHGHLVLQGSSGPIPQRGADCDLPAGRQRAQLGPQLLWRPHQECLELVDRGGLGGHGGPPGSQQHSQRLPVAALAGAASSWGCWPRASRAARTASMASVLALLRRGRRLGRAASTSRSPLAPRKAASPAP